MILAPGTCMTFDEASKIIKQGDTIGLRKHLEEG